jgi:signal transduction histidine kinase
VPLLVLRLPQFERIAWRDGKRAARQLERATTVAFEEAANRVLRAGDASAHDAGSDRFAIALTAPSRDVRPPTSADCRAVLERVAAAMSPSADLRVETGWMLVRQLHPREGLGRELEIALERGARERERYEFFAAIGHELRTPLTSIRGYLETLLESHVDADLARRFLETSRREALRMGRLLDGMFEFSLLDLSADALLNRSCDIARQIELACETLRPAAQSRSVVVEQVRCPRAVVALEADACLQLVVNLLDNAIKYSSDGGRVRVAARICAAEVLVTVDDQGPGIAPGERDSIFGLRVRGAQASARPGTGIGLAIVKMIAERAGGLIRVTDSPLGGARFEASLPIKEELPEQAS